MPVRVVSLAAKALDPNTARIVLAAATDAAFARPDAAVVLVD
eukprot:SAG22_NODE_17207_length_309_cov_1.233333_1_plen_41_part_01